MHQAVAAAVSGFVASFCIGNTAAGAAWFGGTIALANTMMLAWRMRSVVRRDVQDARRELAGLVRSSVERFFLVSLLFAVGLGWMNLMPLPLLAGFALGQLTLVVSTMISGIEKQ